MRGAEGGLWRQLPEEIREKLIRAARGIPPGPRIEEPRGENDPIPPCEESGSPFGPSWVRSLRITPKERGLEETFRKIALLRNRLEGDGEIPSDLAFLNEKGLAKAVFLDLETTGFSSTPLFLAGTLVVHDGSLDIRQFFARDYSQEKSVLHLLSEFLRDFATLVTFNGKSYDVPFLRDRLCYHDLPFLPVPNHLDLLHPARRRWRNAIPNCRLVTLEWYLCGRRRAGDIPGSEVPAVYHEFVRRGHSPHMRAVFHHNVMDLVTLVELLCEMSRNPESQKDSNTKNAK